MNVVELTHEPTPLTSDNYEERSYTITGTCVKDSVGGKKHIVINVEGGFEIFANRATMMNLTKKYGWTKNKWIGKNIYPFEIKEYPKGKSITWIAAEA